MAIPFYEDFIRCKCGGADFRKETIVTLPKGIKPRYDGEKHIEHPELEKQVSYICTKCNQPMDI